MKIQAKFNSIVNISRLYITYVCNISRYVKNCIYFIIELYIYIFLFFTRIT